jgi:predicted HicB family RNase H-like nuclease
MNILKYKEYEGTAELDMTKGVCRGKILFIDDLITYEAASPCDLEKEFQLAVDDYIETCTFLNRAPKKPLKGQFNVRISPALHKTATLRAITDNVCLNDVVVRALESYTCVKSEVNQTVHVTVNMPDEPMKTLVSGASVESDWEQLSVH